MELESLRLIRDKLTISTSSDEETFERVVVHGVFDARVRLTKSGILHIYIKTLKREE